MTHCMLLLLPAFGTSELLGSWDTSVEGMVGEVGDTMSGRWLPHVVGLYLLEFHT